MTRIIKITHFFVSLVPISPRARSQEGKTEIRSRFTGYGREKNQHKNHTAELFHVMPGTTSRERREGALEVWKKVIHEFTELLRNLKETFLEDS